MKSIWSVPFLVCSLLAATGIVVIANSLVPAPVVLAAHLPPQDGGGAAAAVNLSGSWQISWTAENGTQRQASMQITQDGAKLSGKFEGARGSAPLSGKLDGSEVSLNVKLRRRDVSFSGSVDGDKMSGTTKGGGSWTATRQQQQ